MHEVIGMYKIKELAELYGIHTNALRFYEKKGLLPSRRLENGYRIYGEEERALLQRILLYRAMNFTIADIKELLSREKGNAQELYFQQLQLLKRRYFGEAMRTFNNMEDIAVAMIRNQFNGVSFFDTLEIIDQLDQQQVQEAFGALRFDQRSVVEISPAEDQTQA